MPAGTSSILLLGAGAYAATEPASGDLLRPFVGPKDIVHAIRQAVAALEAPTDASAFTRRQAVRFLVHLVGDLHQPMHVTSGYYNTTLVRFKRTPTRIDNPANAARHGVFDDRGGNTFVAVAGPPAADRSIRPAPNRWLLGAPATLVRK